MSEIADELYDQMMAEEFRHAHGECEWGCPLCKEEAAQKEPVDE